MSDGYTIPGMANAHSHAFQRDLRGIAERPAPGAHARDDFWSWRTAMFAAADRLDAHAMRDVARRVYVEMRAAGYSVVGEFHYVHHRPDGTPYEEPNALAHAVAAGAADAGLELVLIPAAYHRNGWDGADRPPADGQRRFCDPTVEAFLERVDGLRAWVAGRDHVHVAVAAHSVRAVPASWLEAIAAYADAHELPRHVHTHEQRRELAECRAEHSCSPIALLQRTGFLGPTTSVIHGVHVDPDDVRTLAESNTIVVSCFEEIRELETGTRRERELRAGLLATAPGGDLWSELAANGRASLGLAAGDPPLIEIDFDHPQLAGIAVEDRARAIATCASAAVVARPAPMV
jgi:formimidoylglutamate deiminase